MNEFVEECRSEWKRLGVPDRFADEMAAELAADLEEAEAEGVSAEEVLGSDALDPRSFATAWAAERGVIQRRGPDERDRMRGSRLAAAIGTFALVIAIIGAVLVIVASSPTPARLALAPPNGPIPAEPPSALWAGVDALGNPLARDPTLGAGWSPREVAPPSAHFIAVATSDSGLDTFGSVLLVVGLAGLVPTTLFLLRRGRPDPGALGMS